VLRFKINFTISWVKIFRNFTIVPTRRLCNFASLQHTDSTTQHFQYPVIQIDFIPQKKQH